MKYSHITESLGILAHRTSEDDEGGYNQRNETQGIQVPWSHSQKVMGSLGSSISSPEKPNKQP